MVVLGVGRVGLLSLRGVSEARSSDEEEATEYPENSQTPELPVAEATARGTGLALWAADNQKWGQQL